MRRVSGPDALTKTRSRSLSTGPGTGAPKSGALTPPQPPQRPKRSPEPPTETPVPDHWTHPALAPRGHPKDGDPRQAIEQRFNHRLNAIASYGLPQRVRHAHQAATALMDLFALFGWPGALCLSLVQDNALWDAFLLPAHAPHIQHDSAPHRAQWPGPSLRPPINGRVLASVIAALLALGEHTRAQAVLDACPQAKNRRVVLKWLLRHSGAPLLRLKSTDAAAAFERVLRDMLKEEHAGFYGRYGPAIEALLVHWHPPANPSTVDGIRDKLIELGVAIVFDPHGHALLVAQRDLASPALDSLADYVHQALPHPDWSPSVPGVVCDALALLGVVVNFQGRFLFHRKGGPVQIRRDIASLTPSRYREVARFVRRCATALMANHQHPALTLTLIRLCAEMDDPERAGDGAFQQAARQAMLNHGVIHPGLLGYDPGSGRMPLREMDALLDEVHEILSPGTALQFIVGAMRYLAQIQPQDPSPENARAQAEWRQLRQRLLDRLVEAFTQLTHRCAEPLDPDWMALARWVWVTQATLRLLPPDEDRLPPRSDSAVHAPCLALFASQSTALRHTLKLLCEPALLETTPAMPYAPVTAPELFLLCAPPTRLAVLRLPLPGLWLSMPPAFDPDLFFANIPELPLETLADQWAHLLPYIEPHMHFSDMSDTLYRLLEAANIGALIDHLRQRPQGHRWAYYLLRAFRERLEESPSMLRPRGLPALLAWCGRVALLYLAQGNRDPWANWLHFLSECANRENSHEPQEPLSVADWLVLGHYLPLCPDRDIARTQLEQLSGDRLGARAHAYLLLGWLRQRFAEVASPPCREQAVPTVPRWLFQTVAKAAKSLTRSWAEAEKLALHNELKPMATQYGALRKKHP